MRALAGPGGILRASTCFVRTAATTFALVAEARCGGPVATLDAGADASIVLDAPDARGARDVGTPCSPPLRACGTACVDTATDPAHCRECGRVCASGANASASCISGTCLVRCMSGFANCDGVPGNGCEVALASDPAHCNACGSACPAAPHATAACFRGMCGHVCAAGFADCDMNGSTGCEVDTRSDREHCGVCDRACPWPARSDFSCAASMCAFACRAGYADCDRVPANGCEITLLNARNCGACGVACGAPTPLCARTPEGLACVQRCPAGTTECDGACVDTSTSREHCGACGAACQDAVNAQGVCAPTPAGAGRCGLECRPGYADCDGERANGCEAQLARSAENCGACGRRCGRGYACGNGSCDGPPIAPMDGGVTDLDAGSDAAVEAGSCAAGEFRCGTPRACVNVRTDRAHCGACGSVCAAEQRCQGGVCHNPFPERVSLSNAGSQLAGDSYVRRGALSVDGRYIAFFSLSTNVVAGDTNDAFDVFVRDRMTGANERVSVGPAGAQANEGSTEPTLSADARFVAFESYASNLAAGDTNALADVFVYDRVAATTERVSVGASGAQANGISQAPSLSGDGRFVAFSSSATNLVAGDTNGLADVFVRDRVAGTTARVSISAAGAQANGYAIAPSLSADGRYVAFESSATNLVAGDTNDQPDVFVHDLTTGATTRVSVGAAGAQANRESTQGSLSGDGRFVAFISSATNLVASDTNANPDAFVHDRQTGATTRVTVSSLGVEANGATAVVAISGDGQLVAFLSTASSLVAGDTNGVADAFVHDVRARMTTRISVTSAAGQSDNAPEWPSLSADGRFVAFGSTATLLVAGDTNARADVFVTRAR